MMDLIDIELGKAQPDLAKHYETKTLKDEDLMLGSVWTGPWLGPAWFICYRGRDLMGRCIFQV